MPRTTRSQAKKSSSDPISSSQTELESAAATDTTSGADPGSSSLSLAPPTATRILRPRALREVTSKPSSAIPPASSSSTSSSLTRRRNRGRGASRSGGRPRAGSILASETVGHSDGTTGIVEGSTTTTARGHNKRHNIDTPQSIPESDPAGRSDQPTERQNQHDHGPPRPDWRNWDESDNEEGLDQLREDEDNEEEEESQVARHLEPTTSSSSQVGTPRQHHPMIPSSSPAMAVAVTNTCSINVTTTSAAAAAAGPASPQTTTTTSASASSMDHPSAPGLSSLNNLITPPSTSSPPSSWRTPASPVTSASLQKIINDVNVEPNVSGRRSATSPTTTTALASPPATGTTGGTKRKRDSSPDIEIIEISSLPPPTKKRDKGKGKARALSLSPSPPLPKPLTQSPPNTPKTQPQNAEEPLSEYTCPICFFPPSNATLTPCGHVCCGSCLFTAVKTTLQRGVSMGMMIGVGENVARCPVCRAAIPGWDGRGGGVVGIKVRQIITL